MQITPQICSITETLEEEKLERENNRRKFIKMDRVKIPLVIN